MSYGNVHSQFHFVRKRKASFDPYIHYIQTCPRSFPIRRHFTENNKYKPTLEAARAAGSVNTCYMQLTWQRERNTFTALTHAFRMAIKSYATVEANVSSKSVLLILRNTVIRIRFVIVFILLCYGQVTYYLWLPHLPTKCKLKFFFRE